MNVLTRAKLSAFGKWFPLLGLPLGMRWYEVETAAATPVRQTRPASGAYPGPGANG
jgi:hypothetical protein